MTSHQEVATKRTQVTRSRLRESAFLSSVVTSTYRLQDSDGYHIYGYVFALVDLKSLFWQSYAIPSTKSSHRHAPKGSIQLISFSGRNGLLHLRVAGLVGLLIHEIG